MRLPMELNLLLPSLRELILVKGVNCRNGLLLPPTVTHLSFGEPPPFPRPILGQKFSYLDFEAVWGAQHLTHLHVSVEDIGTTCEFLDEQGKWLQVLSVTMTDRGPSHTGARDAVKWVTDYGRTCRQLKVLRLVGLGGVSMNLVGHIMRSMPRLEYLLLPETVVAACGEADDEIFKWVRGGLKLFACRWFSEGFGFDSGRYDLVDWKVVRVYGEGPGCYKKYTLGIE